ncbi:hypothetical protein WA158_003892 [Blastocystis sp. Blastoise]
MSYFQRRLNTPLYHYRSLSAEDDVHDNLSDIIIDLVPDEDGDLNISDNERKVLMYYEDRKSNLLSNSNIILHNEDYDINTLVSDHDYLLVYGLVMIHNIPSGILNDMLSIYQFMKSMYNVEIVVMSRYDEWEPLAKKYNLSYSYRLDYDDDNIPIANSVYTYLQESYRSEFYGYIYGDLVQSYTLFSVLEWIQDSIDKGTINSKCVLVGINGRYLYRNLYTPPLTYTSYISLLDKINNNQGPTKKNSINYMIVHKNTIDFTTLCEARAEIRAVFRVFLSHIYIQNDTDIINITPVVPTTSLQTYINQRNNHLYRSSENAYCLLKYEHKVNSINDAKYKIVFNKGQYQLVKNHKKSLLKQ